MYMLFNSIVSDNIHSIVVYVDFLGTHIASLVFFRKLGTTDWYQSDVDYRTYAKLALVAF